MHYDYIIIGGGMTGTTMARLLQMSGVERLLVLEAGDEPGGLCRTKIIDGHVLDTGGGHFLCTKYPAVYDFIFQHLPKSAFNYFDRVSRISIDGYETDYPLEANLWQLPPSVCADYLVSVIQNGEARGKQPPENFEAWIRWKLGDLIAERYMLPYNRKIWGVESCEMDIDWLHKIPRLDVRETALACLSRKQDRAKMPSHAGFYYPKQGGFQAVFDAIVAPVREYIATRTPVTSIERTKSGLLRINGKLDARAVINTAPWHTLANSPVFSDETRRAIAQLRHNELVVSLHEEPYATDAHWLYQPDEKLDHHRSFFIPNFAPHSAPNGVYRETNRRRWRNPHALHVEYNSHAYPIPTLGWARAIAEVLGACEPLGIHGLGRWGQWQYFNSDVCIHEAMRLAERLGHQSWKQPMVSAA